MTTLTFIILLLAGAKAFVATASPVGPGRLGQLIHATHQCQSELGMKLTPAHARQWRGDRYDRWRLQLWKARRDAWCQIARQVRSDSILAIRIVFGPYAAQAIAVSDCETGGTFDTKADNHQGYLGLFQMGRGERARWGHGRSAIEQARAAHRYFVASGRDWSPWQCRPSGGLAW